MIYGTAFDHLHGKRDYGFEHRDKRALKIIPRGQYGCTG